MFVLYPLACYSCLNITFLIVRQCRRGERRQENIGCSVVCCNGEFLSRIWYFMTSTEAFLVTLPGSCRATNHQVLTRDLLSPKINSTLPLLRAAVAFGIKLQCYLSICALWTERIEKGTIQTLWAEEAWNFNHPPPEEPLPACIQQRGRRWPNKTITSNHRGTPSVIMYYRRPLLRLLLAGTCRESRARPTWP